MRAPNDGPYTTAWWDEFEPRLMEAIGVSLDELDADGVEFMRMLGLQLSRTIYFADLSRDHFDLVDPRIEEIARAFSATWWSSLEGHDDIDGVEWMTRFEPIKEMGLHLRSLYSHVTDIGDQLVRGCNPLAKDWQVLFSWFMSELNRIDGEVVLSRGVFRADDWFSEYLIRDVELAKGSDVDAMREWSISSAEAIYERLE